MKLSTSEKDASSSTILKKNHNGRESNDDDDKNEIHGDGNGEGNANIALQDSEYTVDSLTNEPQSGMRWFGGIGTDFLHCLTENVSPVVSGVATLVHKTAVAVANEISQLERDGELKAAAAAAERSNENFSKEDQDTKGCDIINNSSSIDSNSRKKFENLILPWEICQEVSHGPTAETEDGEIPVYTVTDKELMKRIFALSSQDSTFLQPFSVDIPELNESQKHSPSSYSSTFSLDEPRVKLIHRILDIDESLASAHSRLAGDVPNLSETSFWKNYFFHCERVRADEFCRRKKHIDKIDFEEKPSNETKVANISSCSPANDSVVKSTKTNDDDESLVPVGSDSECEHDDDYSYVIQSAPNTGDSFATSRSIGDLVLVDTHEKLARENQL